MITLGKLQIEGFGSIAKEMTFNLHQPGLNILNSANGKGKTTIFSALCWVLYGKSLKHKGQIETWEDKRPKGFKGTLVSLYFGDGDEIFSIHRCIKYKGQIQGASGSSRLVICRFKDEISFKDKNAAQKWIVKKLGMSFELFKNTVVFGQKMKRFIEEDGPTKKQIFEEIFDTSYIQAAKDMAVELRDESAKELGENRIEWDKLGIRLDGASRLLKTHQQVIKDFDTNKAKRLDKAEGELSKVKRKIYAIKDKYGKKGMTAYSLELLGHLENGKKLTEKAEQLEKDAFRLELTYQQNEAEYNGSKKVIKHFIKDLADKAFTCSLCKQKLDPKHQAEHLKQLRANIATEKARKVKLKAQLEKDFKKLKRMRSEIPQLHYGAAMGELKEQLEEVKQDTKDYYSLVSDKKACLLEIDKIQGEKPSTLKLDKVKNEIAKLKAKREPMDQLMNELETKLSDLEWVIKDPLSNSGIKAFIFSQMIRKVNTKLFNYSHIIDGQIQFGIDLDTGNRDFFVTIDREGHIRFYPDLSGGEQQLINICIAFAMYDTINENNPFNLLVLDEVFEGLDDENVEIVGDLVKQKSKGKSLFVITHKRTFIPHGSNLINM